MIRVNLNKPAKFDSVSFTRADLLKIGAKAIDTIIRRCDRGRNVNDRPAKPLSAKYRAKLIGGLGMVGPPWLPPVYG